MKSDRLNVKPKRQRGRNGKGKWAKNRPDNAVKPLRTSSCTCQLQQQPQQQQSHADSPGAPPQDHVEETTTGVLMLKAMVTKGELLFPPST